MMLYKPRSAVSIHVPASSHRTPAVAVVATTVKKQGGKRTAKAPKHLSDVKRAPSAYQLFIKERFANTKEELKAQGSPATMPACIVHMSEEWKRLDEAAKQIFSERASALKAEVAEKRAAKKKAAKPASPYASFVSSNYAAVRAQHPDLNFAQVSSKLSETWATMPAEERVQLQADYQAKVASWQARVSQQASLGQPVSPNMEHSMQNPGTAQHEQQNSTGSHAAVALPEQDEFPKNDPIPSDESYDSPSVSLDEAPLTPGLELELVDALTGHSSSSSPAGGVAGEVPQAPVQPQEPAAQLEQPSVEAPAQQVICPLLAATGASAVALGSAASAVVIAADNAAENAALIAAASDAQAVTSELPTPPDFLQATAPMTVASLAAAPCLVEAQIEPQQAEADGELAFAAAAAEQQGELAADQAAPVAAGQSSGSGSSSGWFRW